MNTERCWFCGTGVQIPFVPTPGRPFYCRPCGKGDIRKLPYVSNFVAFISENLPKDVKLSLATLNMLSCQVLFKEGSDERVLFVLEWVPSTPYVKSKTGVINIKINDYKIEKGMQEKMKALVEEFVKKQGKDANAP